MARSRRIPGKAIGAPMAKNTTTVSRQARATPRGTSSGRANSPRTIDTDKPPVAATKRAAARSPRATQPNTAHAADSQPAWRRVQDDRSRIAELGRRIKALRESKGLTLAQVSATSGLPAATLSRIENSKMSPTFTVLARVMIGLDVDWIDLMGSTGVKPGAPLLSYADVAQAVPAGMRGLKVALLHQADNAHSMPMIAEIDAHSVEEVGGLLGHEGEEFCYVLDGSIALHIAGRRTHVLKRGASALFDSRLPHAYVAHGSGPARILMVVTRAYGEHSRVNVGSAPDERSTAAGAASRIRGSVKVP